ncbi:ATP-dependent RNA helicase RhlB [BD1-7 clade bacterium]|uniref:ATP-dependent RNA helicase RhlB n=1 Tax=BD1-7 clade bacterium TaxID=2029982 RepID=A0A5S9QIC8_9GAMM|nr:ATP-dependent RNA helicase RhlB [BD1-7 clade bacterium]
MIKNWIKKIAGGQESAGKEAEAAKRAPSGDESGNRGKKAGSSKKQRQPAKNRSAEKSDNASAAKSGKRGNSRTDKPKRKDKVKQLPPWDISDFKVPPAEGKTRFHDLDVDDRLMRAIHQLGFDYCTPVQAKTLPHTLKGLDMIGKAQTGTGKTAAFLITIIDQLLSHPVEGERFHGEPRALVVAPTRELVMQIAEDARQLTEFSGLHVVNLVGGEPYERQHKQLDAGYVDILVATPGRLIDFIQQKHVYLDQVETLVLDEADRMLDMGFIPQVKQIVRYTPPKEDRQTLLFSATFTQDILNLTYRWTFEPEQVEIEPDHVATDTVEQLAYMVSDSEKVRMIRNIIADDEVKHAIIFANRRDQTQRLFDKLKRAGANVGILSGEIAQNKRLRTLEDFKSGKIKTLIATDVVGRGIHIDGITHVINYNLPQEPENYVHRIGRTGRAGATGVAISLIGEEDAYELPTLEKLLGRKFDLEHPPSRWLN